MELRAEVVPTTWSDNEKDPHHRQLDQNARQRQHDEDVASLVVQWHMRSIVDTLVACFWHFGCWRALLVHCAGVRSLASESSSMEERAEVVPATWSSTESCPRQRQFDKDVQFLVVQLRMRSMVEPLVADILHSPGRGRGFGRCCVCLRCCSTILRCTLGHVVSAIVGIICMLHSI